jgi:hypothetical protein
VRHEQDQDALAGHLLVMDEHRQRRVGGELTDAVDQPPTVQACPEDGVRAGLLVVDADDESPALMVGQAARLVPVVARRVVVLSHASDRLALRPAHRDVLQRLADLDPGATRAGLPRADLPAECPSFRA